MGTAVTDNKPNETGRQPGTPAAKAKANGTTPTVTARRPISKDEYARTTKASPDATSVIPAVRDDQPAPPKESRPEVDDRPTQTFKAVPAAEPATKTSPAAAPEQKKPEQSKPGPKKPAKKGVPVSKNGTAAAAGGAAAAAAATPSPAAPAAPAAPVTPKPEQKKPEPKKPEQKKPELKRPDPKTKTAPAATPATTEASAGRSARLKLNHVEPWSVTKMAFVVSVALMVVSVVAVTVFWLVMQITGVWGSLNDSVSNVLADDASGFDVTDYLGFGRVVGLTLLVSSLNVIFMTALATIAAHLYNLAAGILGGVEVTFGERQ